MKHTVALVGGDRRLARDLAAACAALEAELVELASVEAPEGDALDPDLVVVRDRAFAAARVRWPSAGAIIFGPAADSGQVIEAIKHGAIDCIVTPATPESLARQLREALRVSRGIQMPVVAQEPEARPSRRVDEIVGQSPAMKQVYKLIGLIAPRDINVLITGESGTGKELVARAILQHSPRRTRAFLAVNCAAIPETLLESELFGHERGAFTGADARRIGKFEQCDGGTIFLDEVGDIPLPTQAKLLRVLQEQAFQRLGGSATIRTDVRIIAATHQPLEKLIAERRFRQDLYYRLKVATIHVPPLREREVDAVLLAHYFVTRYAADFGAGIQSFSPEVLPMLLRYPWPGNVRELENTIKAALVMARGSVMLPEFLPEHIRSWRGDSATPSVSPANEAMIAAHAPATPGGIDDALGEWSRSLIGRGDLEGRVMEHAVAQVEREVLLAALRESRGRIAPAARRLGVSRATLRRKMEEHGIQIGPSA
ncbi:MAG: sigma-54-dependent Fis family transcriptional regulator [Phycisphaeraceae bacterium]|nr:sigma-54 dependent transcriptional regulator [Phycisphaerales bacterium]QOJ17728.1 MAG: sigma-54-dependent Fis family transcriptional regulator [Phycisphaeraceae bacterium]